MAESHGGAKEPAKGTAAHTETEGGAHSFPPFEKDTFASQLVSFWNGGNECAPPSASVWAVVPFAGSLAPP